MCKYRIFASSVRAFVSLGACVYTEHIYFAPFVTLLLCLTHSLARISCSIDKYTSYLCCPITPLSLYSCMRLNLVPLAYLWRRDQTELLQEMIDCKVHSIIIKVASLGLVPDRHLGKSLRDLQPHLEKMKEKYGLNVCGEGGEYETFTLNCPLFKQQICM